MSNPTNKGEKRFKVVRKKQDTAPSPTPELGDAWAGGSSQSIYATTPSTLGSDYAPAQPVTNKSEHGSDKQEGSLEPDQDGWFGGSSSSTSSSRTKGMKDTKNMKDAQPSDIRGAANGPIRQLRKSRSGLSLSERLGMDDLKEASQAEPMPSPRPDDTVSFTNQGQKGRHPQKHLASPAQDPSPGGRLNDAIAQTPLSAYHSPPETPLKHTWRGEYKRVDVPTTPGSEQVVYDATTRHAGSSRVGGLLLQAGGDSPVFPKELQTPKRDTIALMPMSSTPGNTNGSQSQIDAMLAKLKLARTGPGTQESRWAVKEPEAATKTEEKSAAEEKPVHKTFSEVAAVEKSVMEQASTPAVPTAPRALREKSAPQASTPPAKSLLDRIATAETEEDSVPTKSKSNRKRGGRKAESTLEQPAAEIDNEERRNGQSKKASATIMSPRPESPVAEAKQQDDAQAETQQGIGESESTTIAPSTSVASISTNHTTEGSTVGNDTWGTINWADDDDDLPDLPEEWMRAASLASPEGLSSTAIKPSAPENRAEYHSNGNAQRGAKRGGRGRGKKDRQVTPTALPGIKIAGSAVQASKESKQAPKELFPLHKQDNGPAHGSRGNNVNKEQRLHGRPKLMSSNKETFGRLTKGALGVPSPAPAAGPGQSPARK